MQQDVGIGRLEASRSFQQFHPAMVILVPHDLLDFKENPVHGASEKCGSSLHDLFTSVMMGNTKMRIKLFLEKRRVNDDKSKIVFISQIG